MIVRYRNASWCMDTAIVQDDVLVRHEKATDEVNGRMKHLREGSTL